MFLWTIRPLVTADGEKNCWEVGIGTDQKVVAADDKADADADADAKAEAEAEAEAETETEEEDEVGRAFGSSLQTDHAHNSLESDDAFDSLQRDLSDTFLQLEAVS